MMHEREPMNDRPSGRPEPIVLAHRQPFRIGGVEVRPATRQVIGPDSRETIEPRIMQVLVALHDAGGEIVSRGRPYDLLLGQPGGGGRCDQPGDLAHPQAWRDGRRRCVQGRDDHQGRVPAGRRRGGCCAGSGGCRNGGGSAGGPSLAAGSRAAGLVAGGWWWSSGPHVPAEAQATFDRAMDQFVHGKPEDALAQFSAPPIWRRIGPSPGAMSRCCSN
jgi:hypothetical protein